MASFSSTSYGAKKLVGWVMVVVFHHRYLRTGGGGLQCKVDYCQIEGAVVKERAWRVCVRVRERVGGFAHYNDGTD